MKRLVSVIVFFVFIVSSSMATTSAARAQEPVVTEAPKLEVVSPQPASEAAMTWQEFELNELELGARRARNALFGLSASAAVGAAFLFPGLARQCLLITNPSNQEELRCTRSGKALVGIGYPLFLGGTLGMLISGIMLAVRNGKIRRLERRIAFEPSRAIRWDPARASFVF